MAGGAIVAPPSKTFLDTLGRPLLTQATAFDGSLSYRETEYDPRGRLSRVSLPHYASSAPYWTSFVFDDLNRLLSQTAPDGSRSQLSYNGLTTSATDAKSQTTSRQRNRQGQVIEIRDAANGTLNYAYDAAGQVTAITDPAGNRSTLAYDSAGRPATVTYPTGFAVKSVYNPQGYLAELRHNTSNALYWRADASTAAGQLSAYTLGNGLAGSQGYSALTGRLESQTTGTVQSLHYTYDAVGNLAERSDAIAGLTETFTYDALDRLTQHSLNGATNATLGFAYDALGNLTYKSDVGSYTYPASGPGSLRPHAVAAITGSVNGVTNPTYSYDANGNLTNGAGKSFTWTAFDLPSRISQGATQLDFTYGPEHQRLRQISPTATTIYLSAPHYEKETQTSGLIVHKHYLHAGGQLVGLYSQRSNGQNDTRYFATDHLGSVSVVTDEAGAVVERLAYDAWGKRRNSNGTGDPGNALRPAVDRGYTGHEHLDEGGMGLVHMNGRVYDPAIGRFTAPDPLVQAPGFSQSYNRYSYVWNNPLKFTDPSGREVYQVMPEIIVTPTRAYCPGCIDVEDADLARTIAPIGGTAPGSAIQCGSLGGSCGGSNTSFGSQGNSLTGGNSSTSGVTINNTTVSNGNGGWSSTATFTSGCITDCSISGNQISGIGTHTETGGEQANGGNAGTGGAGTVASSATPVVQRQAQGFGGSTGTMLDVEPVNDRYDFSEGPVKLAGRTDPMCAGGNVPVCGGGMGGGGAASGRTGVAGETAVSNATGFPRNTGPGRETIPGSGSGGYRVPDFPPSVTISQRGSVIEVKNYSSDATLSATPQFRDLVTYARGNGAVVEVFSNASVPSRGEFATWVRDGIVRVLPIP